MRKALLSTALLLCAPLLWASAAHATLISVGLQEAGVNGGAITNVKDDGGIGVVTFGLAHTVASRSIPSQAPALPSCPNPSC